MARKTPKATKVHTNAQSDGFEAFSHKLAQAAAEQTAADLDLVQKTGALILAENAHRSAVARKTKAESRLASIRESLAVTVVSQ